MSFKKENYPILGCIKNNVLTSEFRNFVNRQVPDGKGQEDIMSGLAFFEKARLQICYISESIHHRLQDNSSFIESKHLLPFTPESVGLLLLPEVMFPDFSQVPDYVEVDEREYPIDAILYSWLSYNKSDQLAGHYEEDEAWESEQNRELFIIPVFQDGTTQATDRYAMFGVDECFGEGYDMNGREWYGKIHDYLYSFFLFDQEYRKKNLVLSGEGSRESQPVDKELTFLNDSVNHIEIIE